MSIDVYSNSKWPGSELSNLTRHAFVFDGVMCESMEGLLQAFKFEVFSVQVQVCKLVGAEAKKRGRFRTQVWQKTQTLWWKGEVYDRHGQGYQELLDRAYDALATNYQFRRALLATGDEDLVHPHGNTSVRHTVLTSEEFVFRLTKLRARIRATT